MSKQYKIEKFIYALVIIKLGMAVLILQASENSFPTFSFGAPVYAQEGKTSTNNISKKETAQRREPFSENVDLGILKSIEQKEKDIKNREDVLKKREEQLKLLQVEIEQKFNDIKKVQGRIEQLVVLRKDLVEKSIRHLVKVYSSMKPNEAGPLIEKLDRDITIQILSKMKGKAAGKILARVNPTLAAQLSEEIAKRK